MNSLLVLLLLEYECDRTCRASLYSTFSLCLCLTPSSICWSSSSGTLRKSDVSSGKTIVTLAIPNVSLLDTLKGFERCDGVFLWCSLSSPGYSWWELQHPATETPTVGKMGESIVLKIKWAAAASCSSFRHVSKDVEGWSFSDHSFVTTFLTSLAS